MGQVKGHSTQSAGLRSVLLGAAAGVAMLAPGALAQEAEEDAVSVQETIIVIAPEYVPSSSETATKSGIPLVETPQSISVITRDQIDLLNFIDAQQAVRYVAGVSGENYGPDLRFDFISVRGFVPRQFVDGLATPVSTTIQSTGVDLYAFETLDILKGPASVLYGSAPPGGIYNQTSRRAEAETSGEITLKYGTDNYKQIAATGTTALSDSVSGRLTVLVRDREAERNYVEAQRYLVAPTLNIRLSPDTELDLLTYYQQDNVDGDTNGFLPIFGTLLPNPLGRVDASVNLGEPDFNFYERDQYGIGFEFSHRLSEVLKFDANLKYSDYSENRDVIYGTGLLADNRTVTRGNSPYKEDVSNIAADTRLSGDVETGGIAHRFLVGVDYRSVDNNSGFGFTAASPIDLFNPVYNQVPNISPGITTRFNEQEATQLGLYAQDQLNFGKLLVLVSGRFDRVESEYLQAFTPFGSPAPSTSVDQEKFTYRVGANYLLDSGFSPYISYATSFEPVLGADINGDAFDPTTGKQVEAGIKYDGRNLRDGFDLFASAAVFNVVQEDVVATASGPAVPVFGVQLGEVEVTGAEFEFVARIDDALSLNGSYSFTDSEITSSNTPAEIGRPLPVTPEHKISFLVDYTFKGGRFSGFGYNVGVRYSSESAGSLPSAFNPVVYNSDELFLFDASVRYDTAKWRFAINSSNLFDELYVARCASVSNCTYGAGRQVIASVTRKF